MKALFSTLFIFFLFTSCDSKVANEQTCDLESMKCYRGYPQSCDFIKKCDNVEHKFTKERCSKVFNELFRGGSVAAVLKEHTPKILHCFNEKEFKNFGIDKSLLPKE